MIEAPGFERFWKVWPGNSGRYSRKGAKAACLAVWAKRFHETQADQICKHVAWLKTTADWLKDSGAFIPAPLVYLNQQRWDGADIPGEVTAEAAEESHAVRSTRAYLRNEAMRVPQSPSEEVKARLAAIRQQVKGKQ